MIPDIGVLIGAYCLVRLTDVALRPASAWAFPDCAPLVRTMAVVAAVVVLICILDLVLTGGK